MFVRTQFHCSACGLQVRVELSEEQKEIVRGHYREHFDQELYILHVHRAPGGEEHACSLLVDADLNVRRYKLLAGTGDDLSPERFAFVAGDAKGVASPGPIAYAPVAAVDGVVPPPGNFSLGLTDFGSGPRGGGEGGKAGERRPDDTRDEPSTG
ncbi:MAG: hypothetical protein ACTSU5_17800 [Promethearchaeota archaeon]